MECIRYIRGQECFVCLCLRITERNGEGKKVEQLVFKCDTIKINNT